MCSEKVQKNLHSSTWMLIGLRLSYLGNLQDGVSINVKVWGVGDTQQHLQEETNITDRVLYNTSRHIEELRDPGQDEQMLTVKS